ncbi:CoA-binding protein [Saliterribacillus persicus]|uniref:CoA-binding domain-containing protein n=1 Tax=Saliterribacillus persicus TaxID=930114 RepID=A0A368XBG8_9BACI|nr:CoA-binding protein [Saliterribacillus persicus]RCW63777.1 hypothetical protein DFR57_11656 [Saliterribacillus persicus]
MDTHKEQELMKVMLKNSKTIAVVGLSDKTHRTSYQISKAMQALGYRIIPVNPYVDFVLGERAYSSILDVKEKVDLINIFRRSDKVYDIAEEICKTDAPYVWMQQGVVNKEAANLLKENNKEVVMDQCIKVAHAVLLK